MAIEVSQIVAEVRALRQFVPAEDPEPDEGRLEEECDQPLHRERCAEDVADESGVVRPVHPELELLNDAVTTPMAKLIRKILP